MPDSSVTAASSTRLPPAKPNHDFTRRPSSKLGVFFWRQRMWIESTFVLSMLEPWEKILLLTIFFAFSLLLFTGVYKYMPQHLIFLRGRAVYYLWGQEGGERFLWQWLGLAGEGMVNASLHKEL
ncbi:hypothetical protein NLJ89_g10723 [Agrocybe chaxingu]|uniref:Uncharacterized protein n=1 Tax=Agrocybe chaxingu TaxID=84603 RepID=A0A9W8MNM8_9AGAR|nr:hypothetical protein NLJ89_g10723 [Agrocybe chaxingu]